MHYILFQLLTHLVWGPVSFCFFALAGVKTGCSLSATLFLLAMNPIIEMFNLLSYSQNLSRTCLCADDIGSTLRCLHSRHVVQMPHA